MALIRCKECGTEVSDKAAACPKCGAPINPSKPVAPAKKGMGCLSWIIAGFFALVVFVMVSNSVRQDTAPSTGASTATRTPSPSSTPELLVLGFSCTQNSAASIAQGRVKNVSGMRLDSVRVVASFYTKDDTQLGSDFSFLDVQGLLPGQESPFSVHGPRNPAYARCSVDAFMLGAFGRQLRWESAEKGK